MNIHLYTFCWNESFIIPFFLRHYLDVVDKITVYDNESDDNSVELLSKHEKVTVKTYKTDGKINVYINTAVRNEMWKESRGKADWVIVIDTDEFLYFPAGLRTVLEMAELENATLVIPEGYDMVSETLPGPGRSILDQVQFGCGSPGFSKPCVFKPDAIQEINFAVGAHSAEPTGNVQISRIPGFQLLHCKYINFEHYAARSKLHAARVDPEEQARGLNVHYIADEQKLRNHFDWILSMARRVVSCQ